MTYTFTVNNGYLKCSNQRKTIISDMVDVHVAHFTLDSTWTGFDKTASFLNTKTNVKKDYVLGTETLDCLIPWESLIATDEGGYLVVGLSGYKDGKILRTKMFNPLLIEKSDIDDGDNPLPPTPDVYEQIMDLIASMGGTYTLPIASPTTLGGIKVGTNLSIDVNGVLSSQDTTYEVATQSEDGLMSSEDKTKLDGIDNNANNYSLPIASDEVLGGIKIGDNLSIDIDGTLSSQDTTYDVVTTTKDGLMSSEDKVKLDGITGSVSATPNTYVIRDTDADIQTNGIDFDLTPIVDTIPIGHIQWNPTFLCLSYGVKEDSTIEVGQEHVFPVRNGLNVTLENGKVVYWTEAIGASGRVKVGLFIANGTINAERVLGVSTHNLTQNEDGHATWFGSVRGINTTGSLYGETWADGDVLYASPTIAGGMTIVKPTYPNIAIRLGIVINAHATQGQIALKPQTYPLASQVSVSDASGYYDTNDVEAIFDEVGEKLTNIFDDLPPVPFLLARTGTNVPTLTTFSGNIKQYTFAVNDEIFGTSEVTHLYKEGTNLMPHIHWATNGTNTTNRYVKWELEYSWANRNSPTAFTSPTVISIEALIPANTTALTHYSSQLLEIDGTNIKIGAYLCWRVRRITSTGTAPTNNPFGLAFGIHVYQSVLK